MQKFSCVILLTLFLGHCQTVPVESEKPEVDPELTGGFFEGDMDIAVTRNGLIDTAQRWPNGVVHYKLGPPFNISHSMYILQAMQNIESVSCIRFLHATDATKAYIRIKGEPNGCNSRVGYSGTEQIVNLELNSLGKGCFRIGSIMHELLHALGFYHQHSTSDRDNYVKINWANVEKGRDGNFIKYNAKTVTNYGVPYDYGSVMHYRETAFSKNGENTIVPLKSTNKKLGQRSALSDGDIKKLNKMYNC